MRYLIILFVIAVAIFLSFPEIDLIVSGWFFDPARDGFYLKNSLYAQTFNKGIYVLTHTIIYILLLSLLLRKFRHKFKFTNEKFLPGYKQIVFLLIVLSVGPGIITHWVVKEQWGRPRPRQIVEFGGDKEFVPALIMSDQGGKSFFSGHTAMGFYVVAFAFLASGRRRKQIYVATLTFGVITGLSRMVMGAHFLSDTIFAALVMLMTIHFIYWHMFERKTND